MDIDKRLIPPYAIFSIGLLLSFPLRSSEGLGSPRFLCVYASILVALFVLNVSAWRNEAVLSRGSAITLFCIAVVMFPLIKISFD